MTANLPNIKVLTEKSSLPTVKVQNPTSIKGIEIVNDNDSVSSGDTVEATNVTKEKDKDKTKSKIKKNKSNFLPEEYGGFYDSSKLKKPSRDERSESSASESSGSNDSYDSDEYSDNSSESSDDKISKTKQKQEILLKLLNLEKKGVELSKKYSMDSKLSDLKFELEMHKNNAEIDVSVKFQQKLLVAAVTGIEFANKKFDPIDAKLDGWSESVMDNLDDYESIFIRLHEKYKDRADLPPELQLLVTLAGSAFMFHVTKTLFSSAMPKGLDNMQSSEIMKNISKAMQQQDNSSKTNTTSNITGPSLNLSSVLNGGNRPQKKVDFEDDDSSTGTIETSKEITIDQKGKKAINL
tara:strand:- start:6893 stop:7948 length:1056 start_codon:yes stop_codon:yes gene_type:complete